MNCCDRFATHGSQVVNHGSPVVNHGSEVLFDCQEKSQRAFDVILGERRVDPVVPLKSVVVFMMALMVSITALTVFTMTLVVFTMALVVFMSGTRRSIRWWNTGEINSMWSGCWLLWWLTRSDINDSYRDLHSNPHTYSQYDVREYIHCIYFNSTVRECLKATPCLPNISRCTTTYTYNLTWARSRTSLYIRVCCLARGAMSPMNLLSLELSGVARPPQAPWPQGAREIEGARQEEVVAVSPWPGARTSFFAGGGGKILKSRKKPKVRKYCSYSLT